MKCKLCLEDKKLVKSHIIPEFFYKSIYSNSHSRKISVLSTDKIPTEFLNLQKGIREKILCNDCEQIISPWEKYARELIYGSSLLKVHSDSNLIQIEGVDYKKLKLFGISLIWRASVSRKSFFEDVKLGCHEEVIRNMLLMAEPGYEYQYAIVLWAIKMKNSPIKDLVMQPDKLFDEGFTYFRFILGSFMWLFIISRDGRPFCLKDFYLKSDGSILIPKMEISEPELFPEFFKKMKTRGQAKIWI